MPTAASVRRGGTMSNVDHDAEREVMLKSSVVELMRWRAALQMLAIFAAWAAIVLLMG
jgi:hypothetical protein